MPTNQIAVRPSQSNTLSTAFNDFRANLRRAAEENVALAGDGFTQAEKEAMTVIEQLKLTNGMELATIVIRYDLVRDIRDRALWNNHPAGYGSLESMARAQGIAVSELSDTMILCETVFPYIQDTLGIPVAQIWEEIGKSNFRDLTPVLRAIISNQPSNSQSVNDTVTRLLDDTAATLQAAGQTPDDPTIRRNTVEELLEAGALPNRELRNRIRPDRTPPVAPAVFQNGANRTLVMDVTEDQWTMLNNRLRGYMDAQIVDLPTDPRMRQREALRIASVRRIAEMVGD